MGLRMTQAWCACACSCACVSTKQLAGFRGVGPNVHHVAPFLVLAGASTAWWGVYSPDGDLALPPCEFGTRLFFAGRFTNGTSRPGGATGARRLLARQQAAATQEPAAAQQVQQPAPKQKSPTVQKQDLEAGAGAPAPAPQPAAGSEGGDEVQQWCPGQQWVVQLLAEGERLEPADLAGAMVQRRQQQGAL